MMTLWRRHDIQFNEIQQNDVDCNCQQTYLTVLPNAAVFNAVMLNVVLLSINSPSGRKKNIFFNIDSILPRARTENFFMWLLILYYCNLGRLSIASISSIV